MNKGIPTIIVVIGLIVLLIEGILNILSFIIAPLFISGLIVGLVFILYNLFLELYFSSNRFKSIREEFQLNIRNCNDLNQHIAHLKSAYVNLKSKDFGESQMIDSSLYNLNRNEWRKTIRSNFIHHCSAAVCKNANNQPFKYLCKYFDVKISDSTLTSFENVLNDFAAAEQGKELLLKERAEILKSLENRIPKIIQLLNSTMLIRRLGFEAVDLSELHYPTFTFQYVSAGGNSSSRCEIQLNISNLDKFIFYINELLVYKNSIQGQRALMTTSLRERIKIRDNFRCQICSNSIDNERNLLLEIDHVIPLSKGGRTSEENLQTLCWKCNRSKGTKLMLN